LGSVLGFGEAFDPGSTALGAKPGPRSLQPPPEQDDLQRAPAGHCVVQLPPAHVTLQVAPAAQCSLQLPPGQSSAQVESLSHFMSQLPPTQLRVQVPFASQESLQLPSLQSIAAVVAPPVEVLVPAVGVGPLPVLPGAAPPIAVGVVPLETALELVPVGSELAGATGVPVAEPDVVAVAGVVDDPDVAEPDAEDPDFDDPPDRGSDSGIGPERVVTVQAALASAETTKHKAVTLFMSTTLGPSAPAFHRRDGRGPTARTHWRIFQGATRCTPDCVMPGPSQGGEVRWGVIARQPGRAWRSASALRSFRSRPLRPNPSRLPAQTRDFSGTQPGPRLERHRHRCNSD
jgi:hypothetical protein